MSDIFCGYGVPIDIVRPDGFLILKETLTRIGVPSKDNKKLYQSCVIFHRTDYCGNSNYAIMHFKEMFALSGKQSTLTIADVARRNLISKLMEDWNLVKIKYPDKITEVAPISSIKIIKSSEKNDWQLIEKYKVGK